MSGNIAEKDSNKFVVAYMEIGGSGMSAASFIIELPIWQQQASTSIQLRASVGVSTVDIAPGNVPLQLKLLLFGDGDWLELGLGVNVIYRYASREPFYEYSQSKVNPNAVIGYRYQSINRGFVFRVGYTPIYDVGNRKVNSSFGISIGIAF